MAIRIGRTSRCLIGIAGCVLCFAVTGCVESSFTLAADSKLPKCIQLPAGVVRKDVSVTINFYAPVHGADAKFVVKDLRGHTVLEVEGLTKKLSQPEDLQIVTAKGQTDTVRLMPYRPHAGMEQNGRPVALFYVRDGSP